MGTCESTETSVPEPKPLTQYRISPVLSSGTTMCYLPVFPDQHRPGTLRFLLLVVVPFITLNSLVDSPFFFTKKRVSLHLLHNESFHNLTSL